MRELTLTTTLTVTHTEDHTLITTPHHTHAVIALPIDAADNPTDGDGNIPTAYWDGTHPTDAPHLAGNGHHIDAHILDYASNFIRRHGTYTAADHLPRALHITFGLTARTEVVSLSASDWGLALYVATDAFYTTTGADLIPADDLDNPEFIAWLRGDVYRIAVAHRDPHTDLWSLAPDRTAFGVIVYGSPLDPTRADEFQDAADEFWQVWADEHLAGGGQG